MIPRIKIGKGPTGTLRYMQGPGRDEDGKMNEPNGRAHLLGGDGFNFQLNDENVDIARRLMEQNGRPGMQASGTKPCTKDAMHISLSWAREHAPDDDQMREASRGILKALGMSNAMHIVYKHTDKGPHVHMVVSRVNPDTGLAYDNYQDRLKAMYWARQWENEKNERTKATEWIHRWGEAVESRDYDRMQKELFKNEAVLRNTKLKLAIGLGGQFGAAGDALREDFVRKQGLVGLTKYRAGKPMAYTTPEIWKQEARTLAAARDVSKQTGFELDKAKQRAVADKHTLIPEQRDALKHATGDSGLAITSGQAGSGKSRTSKAEREGYESDGRTVPGMAFTHKVTQDMRRDGYNAKTIASALRGKNTWKKGDVIKIDEASQISTDDLEKIMQRARKAGAKVSLTGHSKQFGSIKHGGLFPVIEKRHGSVELKEVMRTKKPDQKKLFNQMAEGNWKGAVETAKRAGSIRWSDTKEEAVDKLVEDYMADYLEDPKRSRIAIAMANDDVNEINQKIRERKKALRLIGEDHLIQTDRGPMPFGIGDRIAINETPPKDSPQAHLRDEGLFNGIFGTIKGIQPANGKHDVTIELDAKKDEPERSIKFTAGIDKEAGDIGGLGYGDARTSYKTQGDTVENSFIAHDPRGQSPSNYVGMSRHENGMRMYVPRETTSGYTQLVEQLGQGHIKTAAHDYRVVDEDRAKLDRPPPGLTQTDRPAPQSPEKPIPSVEPMPEKQPDGEKQLEPGKSTSQKEQNMKWRNISKAEDPREPAIQKLISTHYSESYEKFFDKPNRLSAKNQARQKDINGMFRAHEQEKEKMGIIDRAKDAFRKAKESISQSTGKHKEPTRTVDIEITKPKKVSMKMTEKKPFENVPTLNQPQRKKVHDIEPQRGAPGKGNLQDRTDQTAQGREFIKRQQEKKKGRELSR